MKKSPQQSSVLESTIKQTRVKNKDYSLGCVPEWVLNHKKIKFLSDKDLRKKDDLGPIYNYLFDAQNYYDKALQSRYFKVCFQVINIKGIEDASSFSISFMPNYEKIIIHEVSIKRNNSQIDCLESCHFRMHQRERVNKEGHFHSYSILEVHINDVRVGDIIAYSYTISGGDPALGNHVCFSRPLGFYSPVDHFRTRVVIDASRELYYRVTKKAMEPKVKVLQGSPKLREYVWESAYNEPYIYEEGTPLSYIIRPWLQVTDFQNWREVRDYFLEFYNLSSLEDVHFLSIVTDIAKKYANPSDRIIACVDFVQKSIRYESFDEIDLTLKPSKIEDIMQRRFGDCKDKSILLLGLLRHFGFEAYLALVSTSDPYGLLECLPGLNCFDHIIVYLAYQGQEYWLDGTHTWQSGSLDKRFTYNRGGALVLDKKFSSIVQIPETCFEQIEVNECHDFRLIQKEAIIRLTVQSNYQGAIVEQVRSTINESTFIDLTKHYENYYKKYYPSLRKDKDPIIQDDLENNTITVQEYYVIDLEDYPKDDFGRAFCAYDLRAQLNLVPHIERVHPLSLKTPFIAKQIIKVLFAPNKEYSEEAPNCDLIETPWFKVKVQRSMAKESYDWEAEYKTLSSYVDSDDYSEYARKIEEAYNKLGIVLSEGLLVGNQGEVKENSKKKSNAINYFALAFVGLFLSKCMGKLLDKHEARKNNLPIASHTMGTSNSLQNYINKSKDKNEEENQSFQRLLKQKERSIR